MEMRGENVCIHVLEAKIVLTHETTQSRKIGLKLESKSRLLYALGRLSDGWCS